MSTESEQKRASAPSLTTTIRLKPDELALLKETAQRVGTSVSGLIRTSIRLAMRVPAIEEANIRAFDDLRKQLTGTARNLNQMTRAANSGKLTWDKKAANDVETLRVQTLNLLALLQEHRGLAANRNIARAAAEVGELDKRIDNG